MTHKKNPHSKKNYNSLLRKKAERARARRTAYLPQAGVDVERARARALKTNKKIRCNRTNKKKKTFGFLITRHSTTRQEINVRRDIRKSNPLPEVASQHSRNLTATKYSILYLLYYTTTILLLQNKLKCTKVTSFQFCAFLDVLFHFPFSFLNKKI